MQQNFPFQPRGSSVGTVNLAVTAAAQALGLPVSPMEGSSVRLVNIGTQTVFIAFNGGATVANSMPMLPNTSEVFTLPPTATQISAIAAATGSTLYATLGDGQ